MDDEIIINNKDWIFKTISHQEIDKIPYHFDFTPPARKKLVDYYDTDEIEEIINSPIRWNITNSIKPLYASPKNFGKILKDEFGVEWSLSENDRGTPLKPIFLEAKLSSYIFPDPTEKYRFKGLKGWCDKNREYFRVLWIGDLWERATFMRGMENILMDLILNKDFVIGLLGGICNYILKTMEIVTSRFDFETFSLSDDYGSQKSLQMSPRDWRLFIKPFLKEIFNFAKSRNKIMMLHSCGNINEIIPDLIDMGLDILHPIQPEAIDIYKLKERYGKYLTFQGGLKTQKLLPYGTSLEIENEINILKKVMGKDGGFILEPGITVQGDIPLENLITIIKAAQSIN